MNKKGYTLIEIIISITLVSFIMVSMLTSIVKLKDVYNESNIDTDIRLYQSIISRTINNDIIDHNGIKEIECGSSSSCSIVMNDNVRRKITVVVSNGSPKYSTVLYQDDSNNLLLIKTLILDNNNSNKYFYSSITTQKHEYSDNSNETIYKLIINANDEKYNVNIYSANEQ